MSDTFYKFAPGYAGQRKQADSKVAKPTNFTWFDN